MNSKPLFLHDDLDEYFYNRKDDIKKLKYKRFPELLITPTNIINRMQRRGKNLSSKKNNG